MIEVKVVGKRGVHREVADYLNTLRDLEVESKTFSQVLGLRPKETTIIVLSFVSESAKRASTDFIALNKNCFGQMLFLHIEGDFVAEQKLLDKGFISSQIVPVPSRESGDLPSTTCKLLRNSVQNVLQGLNENERTYIIPTPPPPQPRWIKIAEGVGAFVAAFTTGMLAEK